MRKLVIFVMVMMAAAACGEGRNGAGDAGSRSVSSEAPELLKAVPSDALAAGLFGRCETALDQMLEPESALKQLDYKEFRKQKAALALCDVGSIEPLLIIQTGKAAADTLPQTAALVSQADSLQLFSAQITLDKHNALLLSPSATVLKVARRNLASETSILDAPFFDEVEPQIVPETIVWRNSGASKLFPLELSSLSRKQVANFIKASAEWTIGRNGKLSTVQPQEEKYFCNFLDRAGEGESRLASAYPESAELIIDLPIADLKLWRQAYETMLDARVELEGYNKRIQEIKKRSGHSPLDWEKELGVEEAVYVAGNGYRINMLRCARLPRQAKKNSGEAARPNPARGYAAALYGAPFSSADSCFIQRGKWLVSGPASVLDTIQLKTIKGWPSKASAIVATSGERLICNKENITIWEDSHR